MRMAISSIPQLQSNPRDKDGEERAGDHLADWYSQSITGPLEAAWFLPSLLDMARASKFFALFKKP